LPYKVTTNIENGFSYHEKLGEVVAKWVNCKALGIDGVVLEFYKELWDVVGHDYWLMVSTTIRQGKFPIGFIQWLITLLSKGGEK